jgi:hypothetical protein
MSLPTNLSFSTLDLTHFIETGEHLPPSAGDACPMPAEHYIMKTQRRQRRARLWEYLNERLTNDELTDVKPGIIGGQEFNKAQRDAGYINLFSNDNCICVLTPGGVEPSAVHPSPHTPFVLKTPWDTDPLHPIALGAAELLKEHEAAKEEMAHAQEHLTAVQTAMRSLHFAAHP